MRAILLRLTGALLVVVLVGVGLVALERAGGLPEVVSAAVRQGERQLALILRDVGLGLPPQDANADKDTHATPAPRSPANDRAAVTLALALLNRIPVEAEHPSSYDRGDWRHWLDGDGDCLDARQEVLQAESLVPARLNSDGCVVVGGLWRDAYTGETIRDPGLLDVDHYVSLAEAHRSGGYVWSEERRAAFANDLGDARALIAVRASINRSKGDHGPEEWLPPNAAYRCRYVADWVVVKVRWSLSMDERERVTMGNLLQGCAGQ